MPITSNNPVHINRIYDAWFIRRLSIDPRHDGPWSADARFWRARETEAVIGQDHHGETRHAYELQREESDGKPYVDYHVADVQELAREKAAQGDNRLRDALDTVIQVIAEKAMAEGVIE